MVAACGFPYPKSFCFQTIREKYFLSLLEVQKIFRNNIFRLQSDFEAF